MLEKNIVFNQNLPICCKTGTAVVLKLNIEFITLWHDPMQDCSFTVINIFQLFKQTVLIDADKNCANSDDCGELERRIFRNITLLR